MQEFIDLGLQDVWDSDTPGAQERRETSAPQPAPARLVIVAQGACILPNLNRIGSWNGESLPDECFCGEQICSQLKCGSTPSPEAPPMRATDPYQPLGCMGKVREGRWQDIFYLYPIPSGTSPNPNVEEKSEMKSYIESKK